MIDSNKILIANKHSLKQIDYVKKKANFILDIHQGDIQDILVDFRGRILLSNAECNSLLMIERGNTKELVKFHPGKILFLYALN